METKNLLLVDFDAGVAGVERMLQAEVCVRTTMEFAENGEFREVTDALARYYEWNPKGFKGGAMTGSAVGPLAIIRAVVGQRITREDIGRVVKLGKRGLDYEVRQCRANLMPLRLWERYTRRYVRQYGSKHQVFGLTEARRLCFAVSKQDRPPRVYFAKGVICMDTPDGAVARIGSGESSSVIFLNKFAHPIAAYEAAGSWNNNYARQVKVPDRLDWGKLRPLGKSTTDAMFGVRG